MVQARPIVTLANIRILYEGTEALNVPVFDVRQGETLAVIGPNGSGKSTLLRVIGLLESPTAGEVRLHDRPVTAGNALAERRRMAMVFQQPLLADTSVAENLALGLRFRGVGRRERATRVERWLERFAIGHLRDRRAHTLSGGEAQRVALARALVLEPDLLLLDEPFSGLDPAVREALIPDLGAVLRHERVATVLVTHDRGEAQALADRVAVLIGGRVLQMDETARVFHTPISEEVARFVGVETIVDGRVAARESGVTRVEIDGCVIEVAAPAEPGERVRVCVRPEDVILARPADAPVLSSARNQLKGTVVRIVSTSPHVRVIVDCGFRLVAAVTPRSVDDLGLREGAPVTAVFKASAPHLIRLGRVS